MEKSFPYLLHETAIAWRNLLDTRLKPLGLSQAKWRVLLHLSMSDNPLSQIVLARRLGIEGASLVGLIDRLTKEGWVIRKPDVLDRRIKTITLTQKANTAISKIRKIADSLSQEVLKSTPKKSLKETIDVLGNIKNYIETLK